MIPKPFHLGLCSCFGPRLCGCTFLVHKMCILYIPRIFSYSDYVLGMIPDSPVPGRVSYFGQGMELGLREGNLLRKWYREDLVLNHLSSASTTLLCPLLAMGPSSLNLYLTVNKLCRCSSCIYIWEALKNHLFIQQYWLNTIMDSSLFLGNVDIAVDKNRPKLS